MQSVRCRIWDKAKPQIWLEMDIGVAENDRRFWKASGQSNVPFHQFNDKEGVCRYATADVGGEERYEGVQVESADMDGFVLMGVPKSFYRLGRGQDVGGKGIRTANGFTDVEYRIEFPCV
jgi:hypothetical protein